MTDPEVWDLAVVGAGPAGSVCATVAAQRGLRVALIDQQEFPRDKSCGDGIGPGSAQVLSGIGLDEILGDAPPMTDVEIVGPRGSTIQAPLPTVDGVPQHGYVIPRIDFDNRLFTAATRAGAHDLSGHKLVGLASDDGEHTPHDYRELVLRRNSTEATLRCRLLVGADGAYSAVRRLLGLPTHPKRYTALAMRSYADLDESFASRLVFEFSKELPHGYGWVFPDQRGGANVGVGFNIAMMRKHGLDVRKLLEEFAVRCRDRGIPLGELRQHRSHHLPMAYVTPRLYHPRVVLVGDSAAMINPATGEGIAYALRCGVELANRIPSQASDDAALHAGLEDYAKWYEHAYRLHMRVNILMAYVLTRPKLTDWAIRRMRYSPATMQSAVDHMFDATGAGKSRREWLRLVQWLIQALFRR